MPAPGSYDLLAQGIATTKAIDGVTFDPFAKLQFDTAVSAWRWARADATGGAFSPAFDALAGTPSPGG